MARETRSIPLYRKILFSLVPLFAIEVFARGAAFVAYDFSPYFLVYGFTDAFVDHEEGHTATFEGYFKFPPSKMLHQYGLFAEATPIKINAHGFRGPEFEASKTAGSVRILCMGGSSTFGFYGRDDYTYPVLADAELEKLLPEIDTEVINLGIPHMNTSHIVAMLENEVPDYQPDIITLYSAFNDAGEVSDENWGQAASRWAHGHIASYVALKRVLEAIGGPTLHSRWSEYLPRADAEYINRQAEAHIGVYRSNLRRFVEVARDLGAMPVFIKQPVTLRFAGEGRTDLPSELDWSYDAEVRLIEGLLERDGYVDAQAAMLLVHSQLVAAQVQLAEEEGVLLVDNAEIMRGREGMFASYVHLTEAANLELAKALSAELRNEIVRRAGL